MARFAALLATLVLAAASNATTQAQALARLNVVSFDLAADTASPKLDQPFHLVVTLQVRERVAQIENLNLPMLAQLELLGDERETTAGPHGTLYRETVTVVAHAPGTVTVAPATLQAIDARDNRPKQWFTNGLTLHVAGDATRALRAAGSALLSALLWLAGIALVAALVIVLVRRQARRPRVIAPLPAAAPLETPEPVLVRTRKQQALDAFAVLRTERTRAAAVAVRAAIWRMVGASDGETLADVLRTSDPTDLATRELLIALERSAFTYDADLPAAIDDACDSLERYAESAA
jgi:hypothetical protein